MTTLEATYRIVTPMFCAGADQQSAELRLPSFKGALRFWWRTLMWGSNNGRTTDVNELHRKEAALFGASGQSVGQSKVRMRLVDSMLDEVCKPPNVFENGQLSGAHYLGYGVMEAFSSHKKGTKAGQLTRPMIPGGRFTIQLHLLPSVDDLERVQLQLRNALILLGLVGGLGSKSRKGFGSLTLASFSENGEPVTLPSSPAERIQRIRSAIGSLCGDQPEWTAWSTRSRVITVTDAGRRPVELLDGLGREQVYYRSWGNHGRVIDRDSERNFPKDHDLSKGQMVEIGYPRRIVFGLPHNYGKGDLKTVGPASRELDRRASPLFLHVHQTSDRETPVGVVAVLPSRFLPDGEKINAFGQHVPLDTSDRFWQPLHGYLDRLIGAPGATPKRTNLNATEVSLD